MATRRDIITKGKVDGEDVANKFSWLQRHYTGDPAVAGPTKDIVDRINADLAAMTAAMATFAASAP